MCSQLSESGSFNTSSNKDGALHHVLRRGTFECELVLDLVETLYTFYLFKIYNNLIKELLYSAHFTTMTLSLKKH